MGIEDHTLSSGERFEFYYLIKCLFALHSHIQLYKVLFKLHYIIDFFFNHVQMDKTLHRGMVNVFPNRDSWVRVCPSELESRALSYLAWLLQ